MLKLEDNDDYQIHQNLINYRVSILKDKSVVYEEKKSHKLTNNELKQILRDYISEHESL